MNEFKIKKMRKEVSKYIEKSLDTVLPILDDVYIDLNFLANLDIINESECEEFSKEIGNAKDIICHLKVAILQSIKRGQNEVRNESR